MNVRQSWLSQSQLLINVLEATQISDTNRFQYVEVYSHPRGGTVSRRHTPPA
jgi:hypothetical protein